MRKTADTLKWGIHYHPRFFPLISELFKQQVERNFPSILCGENLYVYVSVYLYIGNKQIYVCLHM